MSKPTYKSAAQSLGRYYDALSQQTLGSMKAKYNLKDDYYGEQEKLIKEKEEAEKEQRGINRRRGWARLVGTAIGVINPVAGVVANATLQGANLAFSDKPERLSKKDFKFKDRAINSYNETVRDWNRENIYKLALSTATDAVSAHYGSKLLGEIKKDSESVKNISQVAKNTSKTSIKNTSNPILNSIKSTTDNGLENRRLLHNKLKEINNVADIAKRGIKTTNMSNKIFEKNKLSSLLDGEKKLSALLDYDYLNNRY